VSDELDDLIEDDRRRRRQFEFYPPGTLVLADRLTFQEQARLFSRVFGGNIESRELSDGAYEHTVKET
jgi:hypothetical protein